MGKLGDTLRERRIALGMSLDDVQQGTKIRTRLIEALEEGAYDRLPNPGYVRGYISSYARYLELDSGPLLNMYKAETGAGRFHELNLPQTGEAVKRTGEQHAVPWSAGVSAAVVIAVVSLLIWGGVRLWRGPEPTSPEPLPVSEATATPRPKNKAKQTARKQEGTSTDRAETETEQTPVSMPFTLTVRVAADGASWLRIVVDDKPAYEGTLAGGQQKEYEVTSSATVRVGKPESVTILRDGTEVDIENDGDVPTVTIDATETAR